jgi:hypothetical protein
MGQKLTRRLRGILLGAILRQVKLVSQHGKGFIEFRVVISTEGQRVDECDF